MKLIEIELAASSVWGIAPETIINSFFVPIIAILMPGATIFLYRLI